MSQTPALPLVAFMQANHAAACKLACNLWKGAECQNPYVSEVLGRATDKCVRPLRETLALAGKGTA